MTIRLIPLLLLTALPLAAATPARRAAASHETKPSSALRAKVDAYVAPLLAAYAFSGVVFVAKGDDVVFEKGYGMANYEFSVPNRPDTRFAIASVTKLFTRAILQRLFEEKKLSPDQTIAKWLPDFPSADRITIDHLARHRSGIRDPQDLRRIVRVSFTTAEAVKRIAAHPLGSEPGKEYSYTTANYAVLAHILERVTGKTYAELIREIVYEPAGMRDSGELSTAAVVPRLAAGYMPDPLSGGLAACEMEDPSWKTGGGSSYTTARDLLRFVRAYYANRFFASRDFNTVFPESKIHGRRALQASGSFPGASANLVHFPDDGVTVVVLSNNYANVPSTIARDVSGMMFDVPYQNPVVPVSVAGRTPDAQILGRYTFENRPYTVSIERQNGRLVASYNEVRRSALIRVSDDTWFSLLDWWSFHFAFDASGRVTAAECISDPKDRPVPMAKVE